MQSYRYFTRYADTSQGMSIDLMKQCLKSQGGDGASCRYICQHFPFLSNEKMHAGIFSGSQVRQLIKDEEFIETMNHDKKVKFLLAKL